MSSMNLSHQAKLFDPRQARPVHLMGAGSVGSWVALFLAKAGVEQITVWDADSVGSHNVPMSAYGKDDVGKPKVLALAELVERQTGIRLNTQERMYEGEPLKNASVISCVDSMAARSLIWNQVRLKPTIDVLCDTRLDATYIDVLTVEPTKREDVDRYEKLLFPDEEANMQVCGHHGIAFTTSRAAGIVVANLTRFWTHGVKEWRVAERCDTLVRVF